LAIKEIRKSL